MHNPDFLLNNLSSNHIGNVADNNLLRVHFSEEQQQHHHQRLVELIHSKIENREFFYGIELSAGSYSLATAPPPVLDYRSFGSLLPLFTSLVWFGPEYCDVQAIEDVDAVRLGRILQTKTIVMPHFTCYRMDRRRLESFLTLNFPNVLVLRGDEVASDQKFLHASDLVLEMKRIRGDTLSLGVGGYPQGHPDAKSKAEDMQFLIEKVNFGADFIITQVCFSSKNLIDFVDDCRENNITVPIIIGVYIPESLRALKRMCEITRVQVPQIDMKIYESFQNDQHKFKKFAIHQAVKMIDEIFRADIDIFGVQFFTMNKFESIRIAIHELREFFENKNKNKLP